VFLGLDGVCVKSHGGADTLGFAYAIGVAVDLVRYEYKNKLVEGLAKLRQVTATAEASPPALQATGGAE
jgi:glycerol-3-phosphate acyltransferase PlsX